jgi:hypothetical protein
MQVPYIAQLHDEKVIAYSRAWDFCGHSVSYLRNELQPCTDLDLCSELVTGGRKHHVMQVD